MLLFIFACLILGKTFEAQYVSGSATFQSKGYSNDAQYLSETDANYLSERNALLEVKRLQSGLSTVKNTFLGLHNSTVGLKNVAIEHSSSAYLTVSSSDYFLLSGKSKMEQIHDCVFKNMSVKLDNNSDYQMAHSSEQGGALYVHDNEKAILRVENSSFTRCNASSTRGGGIYALKIAECIVLHSSFSQCTCASLKGDGGGGGIRVENVYVQSMVDDCTFRNCSSGNDGGAMDIRPTNTKRQKECIINSLNTTNRVSTDTYAVIDKSEWLRNDFGIMRFVSSTETQPYATDTYACGLNEIHPCGTLRHCLTQLIPDIATDIEILTGTITETKKVDCGINTFTIYGQSDLSSTVQIEFEASGLSLFSVSAGTLTARDFVLVHDSVHLNNRGSRLFEITGAGEMHISGLNISFGSGQSSETAFTTELINVQSGMLKMENVNCAKTISTVSLFSLSSTNEISLTLSECTFIGIERTTSGAAVISFSNDKANIDLNSSTFEGCGCRTSTDGGSIMLCVGNGNEVKVKGGSFDGCYCSATYGFGGGILLRLLNENPDFLISSSFGTNTAKWGSDIFVLSQNLEVIVNPQKISCVSASLDSVDKVRGYDNGNTSVAIPLCIYLLPTPEEIYVSNSEASDHSHCGIVQFPCLTMKHSLTRQTGTKKVVVNGMVAMSDELDFIDQKHEIKGNDDQSGWTVSDSSSTSNSSMISANVETVLSTLIFSLPSSFSSHSIFISSSSQLSLSHCSLILQNSLSELTFLFLSVESETLYIDSFSASSIDLSGSPLISLSGSGTSTESMSTKWLNMTNSIFSEIERAAGSGGCVSIDNSNDENRNTQINIEKCDFDGCSVLNDESRGGAINAQLKGNTQLNIISCTFTECTAPTGEEEKTGFGGGMALKLIDDYSSFMISSPIFEADKPNVARYGNDLFVEALNLTKSITNTSLPFVSENLSDISLNSMRGFDGIDTTNAIPLVYFWRTFGSEIFIERDGKDVCICGLSDYPCLSIDYSLNRLPEGNERKITIIGKGILQKCVDLSGISISSNNIDMCSLECYSSLGGTDEAVMKISGTTNFELIDFAIPTSFENRMNVLMHVGSSEGLLTVKDCSFTKMEESVKDIINYGLIKADGGTVQLEFATMQSFSFAKDVICVLPTTILYVKNLTMKNVYLNGASGLRISKSSGREKNEEEQDVLIEWSSFEEVTQNTTDDIPIIRNTNDEPLKMVIRNTTMKRCGGLKCGKGGGMFCGLNEGGSFDCSFCTISESFCSTTGRGVWMFLECSSVAEKPLNFVLSNITFRDNSAFRGGDVYMRCHSIETQIVEEQFLLDFRAPFVKELAMWGCTTDSFIGEEDLLLRVMRYQSETIFVSSVADNHTDSKQCGEFNAPCQSMDVGVQHIIPSSYSQLLIAKGTIVNGECSAHNVSIHSLESPSAASVHLNSTITGEGSLITTSEKVRIESVKFFFGKSFSYSGSSIIHEASGQLSLSIVDFSSVVESNSIPSVALNSSLLSIANGILHVDNCSLSLLSFKEPSLLCNGDEINITNFKLEQIESITDIFVIGQCKEVAFNWVVADEVELSEGCIIAIHGSNSGTTSIGISSFNNCSRNSGGPSVLSVSSTSAQKTLSNCTCTNCVSLSEKGSVVEVSNATNVLMDLCRFIGVLEKEKESDRINSFEEICKWNGSLVHLANSSLVLKDVTISNSSSGGITISGGNFIIEAGNFSSNNPFVQKYPSLRRNIICSDSASLTISSLKGGDGVKDNSSLWILNDECTLGGISGERQSPFFIPKLEEASLIENGNNVSIKLKGALLLPCDLSFMLMYKTGDVELVEAHQFEEDGFVSETEVLGTISSENISKIGEETEVSVMILFGKQLESTSPQILKNRSDSKVNGDERISEGGKEEKSTWNLIVIVVMGVLFVIFMFIFAAVVVLLRKKLKEMEKKVEKERLENEEIMGKLERRRRENNGGSFEMSDMPSTLLEGMTSQIPLLIDNDEEDGMEAGGMRDEEPNENDVSYSESPLPFSENASASGIPQSHSFNVISAKNPFREKEKKNIKTLYSAIHSVQGNFTMGTRAMDVVDGKKVVLAVAELFEHLISVGDERVEMMARQLCPYAIFVEEGNENEIYLLSEELEEEKQKEEMKRWKAPEAGDEEEGIEKAVVFTLGLILHEMTTGEVPLSECNAEEAQEMMRDGVRPLTEGIEGTEMVEVMEKMWTDEPNDRPSLVEVISSFDGTIEVL
ncbi:uncharacterized protein MONOS_15284 [Monocercomonoides exilis]|uniref:uncharacterized protein n=1 Tax=Monocercomonoides exilis TaxID=2049356 RepID=UPI00355A7CA4|nr:hypothetical protein MONOS_15284 [Monocercomonoides exilis]|eukprot:MONOS_15284.1-p1 / transcript=MONOS_15284.1 / gene=MONOS_15284 / organism=Monocercomonoides_exilis_PA203 / gene_product=unspecified product / transcript_product=unspecified product / location=Mono_scaffold01189:7874-15298(-) / protein_length=2224 / sequence_SO=supercontig / SO=protein_coding / is_pseudo=false